MEEIKLNDNVVYLKTADVKPYDGSHKTNNAVSFLKKSLQDYGFQQPIVIDNDNVVVAGNGLYKAAVELGIDWIPCIKADYLTEEEVSQYRIADNKTSEFASWNEKKLRKELSYLDTPQSLQYLFEQDITRMLGLNAVPSIDRSEVKTVERPITEGKREVLSDDVNDRQFKDKIKNIDLGMVVRSSEYHEYHCSKCGRLVKVKRR